MTSKNRERSSKAISCVNVDGDEPALGAKDCGEVLLPGKRFGVREILKPAGSAIVFLRLADRTAAAGVARECPPPKEGGAAAADDVERVPQARRRLGGPELADRRDAGVQRLRVAAAAQLAQRLQIQSYRLQSYKATKLPSHKAAKLQRYTVTKLQSYKATKSQSHKVTKRTD